METFNYEAHNDNEIGRIDYNGKAWPEGSHR